MTGTSAGHSAFDEQAVVGRTRLDQVATLVTSPAMCPDPDEMLVIALRPDSDDRRVLASAGNSAVRASISVSIAAGNQRAWAPARTDQVVDVPVAALPEIIRAAIQPAGIHAVRVGVVQVDDTRPCLAMWLTRATSFTPEAEARHATILQNLADAEAKDRAVQNERAAEAALAAATAAPEEAATEADPLETMPSRSDFDTALARLRSDETGLIVLGIDNIDAVAGELGEQAAEQVRRTIAARLSGACRRNDVVARISDNSFAVLLVDVDRRAAFEISKRLRADVSEPVDIDGNDVEISMSVGLSHEAGLVDAVELFISAESAMEDAHQAGGARMLVAC